MREQLPILDELERAETFAAMGNWLAACPLAVFVIYGVEIERIAHERGFAEAADYAGLYQAALAKRRAGPDRWGGDTACLMDAARRRDGTGHDGC